MNTSVSVVLFVLAGSEETVVYQYSQDKKHNQNSNDKKSPSYVNLHETTNPYSIALNSKVNQIVVPGDKDKRSMPFLSAREFKMTTSEIIRRKSLQEHASSLRASFPEFHSHHRKSFQEFPSYIGIGF